jgi:hypothetical protein
LRTDQQFLNQQRLVGDPEADVLISDLFASQRQQELYSRLRLPLDELFNLPETDLVAQFLLLRRPEPEWFDERQVLRGQRIFETYAVEIMTLLGVMALPYCYAGVPGNKALFLSVKMIKMPGKRLIDTADFIIGVSTVGNLTNRGDGHVQINRTRLIHAIARFHLNNGTWNQDWGVPINQEDLAGTNLAFSCIILFGLQQSGIIISNQQKEDYISLWRYIGFHLGISEEMLPENFKDAVHLVYLIKERNFRWSEEGVALTRELITYYQSVLPESQSDLIASQIRLSVGADVASCLGIKSDSLQDSLADVLNAVGQLKNILKVHRSSFQKMILQHAQMKVTLADKL